MTAQQRCFRTLPNIFDGAFSHFRKKAQLRFLVVLQIRLA